MASNKKNELASTVLCSFCVQLRLSRHADLDAVHRLRRRYPRVDPLLVCRATAIPHRTLQCCHNCCQWAAPKQIQTVSTLAEIFYEWMVGFEVWISALLHYHIDNKTRANGYCEVPSHP